MPPQPALVLDRVLRVLEPLVRLLIRHGVGYPALAAALKRVFLHAATAELESRGMAVTDSAVTLLSGVHRRDVRELTRGAPAPRSAGTAAKASAAPAAAPPSLGLASEVIARWMQHKDFRTRGTRGAAGAPRTLPRSGGPRSFDALVEGITSDVRPRAVLDELLRLGVVREDDDGIHLDRAGFVPRDGFPEMAELFAQNLHDHAAAAAANLQGEANFLEQAVFVDRISAESAKAIQKAAVQAWKAAFRSVMGEAQRRFDHDAEHASDAMPTQRARFGVYFFAEPDGRGPS